MIELRHVLFASSELRHQSLIDSLAWILEYLMSRMCDTYVIC